MLTDFELQGSDGKTYHLADFKDHQAVVLAWFPKAFTSGCTIECKSLADDGNLIEKYDVTYFMGSVDEVEGEKGNQAFANAHKDHARQWRGRGPDHAQRTDQVRVAQRRTAGRGRER